MHRLRRRLAQPDRLRVLERRRASSRRRRTCSSSRTPTATTRPTSASASFTASTRPTRTTRPTASCSIRRGALLPGRDVPSLAGRRRPGARRERLANGGVFRYEPRTQKFDVYVTFGFANPHGHVFDRWGQDIVVDGTGAKPYHAPLFSGHVDFPAQAQPRRRRSTSSARGPARHRDSVAAGISRTSSQGNLLVANVIGFQGILRYKIDDNGASFSGRGTRADRCRRAIRTSARSMCEIGPDGAIYFTDWQNPIIGHMQHNLRDPEPRPDARPRLSRDLRRPRRCRSRRRSPASRSRSCSTCSSTRRTAFAIGRRSNWAVARPRK